MSNAGEDSRRGDSSNDLAGSSRDVVQAGSVEGGEIGQLNAVPPGGAGEGRRGVQRVPGETPNTFAIDVIERPGSGSTSRVALMTSSVATVGRPPTRPRARAAAKPSRAPAR